MSYEGARTQTAEQMNRVLHMPADPATRRAAIKELSAIINADHGACELNTANALWAQEDYAFMQEYLDIITQYYQGRVTNLDFRNDTENSRKTINDWVAAQTEEKIKNLIPQGALSALTRLVLTNAIYFKATWQQQFLRELTTRQPFMKTVRDTVYVPMMGMINERFPYAETPDAQVLELPYSDDSISMIIILPRTHEYAEWESGLDTARLDGWLSSLSLQKIDVFVPRFTLETKYSLGPALSVLGMPIAFSADADFSGMNGRGDLFISRVIHQAFVDVDEQGTEAAAATGIIMEMTVARPRAVFRADHPFLFLILDKRSGAYLFMGRVNDPS